MEVRPFLILLMPDGQRRQVPITTSPFRIGRRPDCELVLNEKTISKDHAWILSVGDRCYLEDRKSTNGVFVNGTKIIRGRALESNDVIKLGISSYQLIFTYYSPESDLTLLLESLAADSRGGSLHRLGAVLKVARALETQSLEEVLAAVVNAALDVTGAERGFLLLCASGSTELELRVARDSRGRHLDESDLHLAPSLIQEALRCRRGLLAFGPGLQESDVTVDDLSSPSGVCVPLVRVRFSADSTSGDSAPSGEPLGVLCLDSRLPLGAAGEDQYLLMALAAEASAALENARLWSEARQNRRLQDEVSIAARIQSTLLRVELPAQGWLQAVAASRPCFQVGGDYYDVMKASPVAWSAVVADVAGKGLSAALLASLLQGAFSAASLFTSVGHQTGLAEILGLLNRYVFERSLPSDYATVFYCALQQDGLLRWASAGHCPALLVRTGADLMSLCATGLPLAIFSETSFTEERTYLQPGDKVVINTDGVTEAENAFHELFSYERLEQVVRQNHAARATELHQSILEADSAFTADVPQSDDITLVVLEYCGAARP